MMNSILNVAAKSVIAGGMPPILFDIQNHLREVGIQINEKVEGEGRGGSLKDEGTIKKVLMEHDVFKKHVIDEKARGMGDITVLDYDETTIHVVNIKTSIGSTDNCFSKIGFVYALTSLKPDELPKTMNYLQMNDLINQHKCDDPMKDYWFLCVDKTDSKNVMVRGAKQINCWIVNINPSNVLQINWKKEKTMEPVQRTWDEAYDVMMGGVKKSINGFVKNIPEDWLENKKSEL